MNPTIRYVFPRVVRINWGPYVFPYVVRIYSREINLILLSKGRARGKRPSGAAMIITVLILDKCDGINSGE